MRKFLLLVLVAIGLIFRAEAQTQVTESLTNGLVAYYPLNGDAKDYSINKTDGIIYGTVNLSQNRFGTLYASCFFNGDGGGFIQNSSKFNNRLDNVGQYCNAADNFTVSLWVFPSRADALFQETTWSTEYWYYDNFIVPAIQGGDGSGVGLYVGTNGLSIYEHGNAFLSPVLVCQTNIGDNWVHACYSVQNNEAPKLYINGKYIKRN